MVNQSSVQIEQNNGWTRWTVPQNLPSEHLRNRTSTTLPVLATKKR